jgi:MerR family transcriptional regulator, redox-sensitive transcriptional activator SoxR
VKIGELARRTGLKPSAIRYYERLGLLPVPGRVGGQRRYSDDAHHRVLLIRFASDMGFALAEIELFLSGLRDNAPVGPRWKKLANRKIQELDAGIKRAGRLKSLLEHLLRCRCASLQVCVQRLSLSPNLRRIAQSKPLSRIYGKFGRRSPYFVRVPAK